MQNKGIKRILKENNLKIFFGNTEYREKEMKMAKIKLAGKKKT